MNANDKDSVSNKVERGVSDATDKVTGAMREGGKAASRMANEAGDAMQAMKDSAGNAVEEGKSRAGDALRMVQDTAIGAKDAILDGAGSTLASVKDVAVEKADAARETLSDVGERLAATLQRASDETGDEDALKSRVLSTVAQGLTTASDALRQRSVSDLGSDLRTLARRHPAAFMAAAAVAGFAAARFIRSSARRDMAGMDRGQGPRV